MWRHTEATITLGLLRPQVQVHVWQHFCTVFCDHYLCFASWCLLQWAGREQKEVRGSSEAMCQRESDCHMFTSKPSAETCPVFVTVHVVYSRFKNAKISPSSQNPRTDQTLLMIGGERKRGWDQLCESDYFCWGLCSHSSSSPWLLSSTAQSYWKCVLWNPK